MSNYRCCPICFRGGHETSTNFLPGEQKLKDGESLQLERRFFRVFPRYLDISDYDYDDGDFPLDKLPDLNLICCCECTKVMESFSELYHNMKTIELHLNWKVLTLKNIMMSSKRVPKRAEIFEECVKRATKNQSGSAEVDADKLIKSVMKTRNMLIEKCCQKMTNVFPKIAVTKGVCLREQSVIEILPKQKPTTSMVNSETSVKECTYVEGEENRVELILDPTVVPPSDNSDIFDDNYEDETSGSPSPLPKSTKIEADTNEMHNDNDEPSHIKLDKVMDIDENNTPLPDLQEVQTTSGAIKVDRSVGGLRARFRCTHCSMRFSLEEKLQLHITEAHGSTKRRNDAMTSTSSSESGESEVDNDYDSDDNMSLSSTSISSNDEDADLELDFPMEDAYPDVKTDISEKPYLNSMTHAPPNDNKINAVVKKTKKKMYCIKKHKNNLRFRFKCPDCDELFKDVKSLLLHRKDTNACEGKYDPTTIIRVQIRVRGDPKTVGFTNTSAVIDLPQQIFICEECDLPLYKSEQAEAHKKLHGKFPCNFCRVTKTYAPELAIHELRHKSENKKIKRYRPGPNQTAFCPRCDFQCSYLASTSYVKHHLKSHLSLLYENPTCAVCNADFFRINHFLIHLKDAHDLSKVTAPVDIKRCTIGDCRAYFLTSNQLTLHLNRQHNILNRRHRKEEEKTSCFRYKCPDCNKSYVTGQFLRSHRLKKHVSSKEAIPCPISKCSRIFESKRELEQHIKISSKHHAALENPQKEQPAIPCPQCNKLFAGQKALKLHSKSHRHTPQVCDICGMVFKYKAHLDRHYPYHLAREDWKFECEICKKKCATDGKLKEHMITHTQERNYMCQICGAKYACRRNLRVHVNSKHGDLVQDVPKKIDTTNFKSRKGIKRWKPAELATSSSTTTANATPD